MARRHFAKALVASPDVHFDQWMETLRNQNEGAVPKDHVNRIAKSVLRKADPRQYLLSHATIVASVDTYQPAGAKTGRQMNRGVQIDVKYPDFRIKPDCHEIVNNNGDAWERSLLLSTYRTFIGAHNYLEHIQIPELSKGFIVDAIARDLGKTAYIDILVATDRKHGQLITDISSGEISAMSMGCISLFTICTKCGNVASDDSQLCPCVMYEGKGTPYRDESGVEHPISELIGHVSVPNSNQFIEASWVRNPAFKGAVRRNILNGDSPHVAARMNEAALVHELRRGVRPIDGVAKAASVGRVAQGQQGQGDGGSKEPVDLDSDADIGMDDQGGGQGGGQSQGGQSSDQSQGGGQSSGQSQDGQGQDDKINTLLDTIQERILTIIGDKLGDKLKPKPEDVKPVTPADLIGGADDNFVRASRFDADVARAFPGAPRLVRWASNAFRVVHVGGVKAIRANGMTPRDLIILSWIEDRVKGRSYPAPLYKVAMQVGSIGDFPSEASFVAACRMKLSRDLTAGEQRFLKWKGRIASFAKF